MDQANCVIITPRPTASVAATVPTSETVYSPAAMLSRTTQTIEIVKDLPRDGFKVDETEADRVQASPRTGLTEMDDLFA
jgi:hypothetical protein